MTALYCSTMERKIGTETCEQRKKNITQFPMCDNCNDYEINLHPHKTDPKKLTTTNVIKESEDDFKSEMESRTKKNVNPILEDDCINDEAIESNEISLLSNLRECKNCHKMLEPIDANFSSLGKTKTMIFTCKKCMVKLREESRLRNKHVKENELLKVKEELRESLINATTIVDYTPKIKPTLNKTIKTEIPKDAKINKKIVDGKFELTIEYLDLNIKIIYGK